MVPPLFNVLLIPLRTSLPSARWPEMSQAVHGFREGELHSTRRTLPQTSMPGWGWGRGPGEAGLVGGTECGGAANCEVGPRLKAKQTCLLSVCAQDIW